MIFNSYYQTTNISKTIFFNKENKVMSTGTVKWFNETKGYGFITPDDGEKDLFVHKSDVRSSSLQDGDQVEYEVGEGRKGPCAKDVEVI